MQSFMKINENICRGTIPYKDIFTTVYTVRTPGGVLLFDAASYDEDTPKYLLPFLQQAGVTPEEVKYVFISHNHTDHGGGLKALLPHLPNAAVLSRSPKLRELHADTCACLDMEDGDLFLDVLQVVTIPGHSKDSSAIVDKRTKTMISGDCLQAYGICGSGTWAANITRPVEYLDAIDKLRGLDISQLLAAHDYQPYGFRADGSEAYQAYLDSCIVPLRRLQKLILENPGKSFEEVQALFNHDPQQPKISARVVEAMANVLESGAIRLL